MSSPSLTSAFPSFDLTERVRGCWDAEATSEDEWKTDNDHSLSKSQTPTGRSPRDRMRRIHRNHHADTVRIGARLDWEMLPVYPNPLPAT